MKRIYLIAAIGVSPCVLQCVSQPALADVRHETFPVAVQGAWMPGTESCDGGTKSQGSKSRIVISERKVDASDESCTVEYVIERPLPDGTMYSGRTSCPDAAAPNKTILNLIVVPKSDGRALIGKAFDGMNEYQRCDKSQ